VSRLTYLIAQAKVKDPRIGVDLEREFKSLSSRLPYGLNFERHRPEAVKLPQRLIRRGGNGAYPTVSGGGRCAIWLGAEKERLVAITGLVLVMIVALSRVAHYFDVSIQSSLLNLC
jgi:hypothetical protein